MDKAIGYMQMDKHQLRHECSCRGKQIDKLMAVTRELMEREREYIHTWPTQRRLFLRLTEARLAAKEMLTALDELR